jgi:predicted nucleic acid-binding protein
MIRVALDTNILAYLAGISHGVQDETKIVQVRTLIEKLADGADLIAPAQALGELFVVLRRSGADDEQARAVLLEFASTFTVPPSEARTMLAAADLVVNHKLQFWDSLIITAATEAGCTLLLSEDMQHGFITRGLTIVNPLNHEPHPRLTALLDTLN